MQPVSYQELLDVGHMWVDAALNLTDRELRTMERLVRAQSRLATTGNDDDIVETVRRVGDAS